MTSHPSPFHNLPEDNMKAFDAPDSSDRTSSTEFTISDGLEHSFSKLHIMDMPPTENPRVEDVEKIAASEMNQLSMESREQILYDLHGISEKMPQESDELLSGRLQEFQVALDLILDEDKEAYNLAVMMNPAYVENRDFRLKFLRADLFDATQAAVRFTKHFQAKMELFGADLLAKDITQDDLAKLGDKSLECLYSGWFQELPIRDISGRLISVLVQKSRDSSWTADEKCRAIWYRRMINSDEIETQRHGIVVIVFNHEQEFDRTATWKASRLTSCLPVRFVGFHSCLQNEYFDEKQDATLNLGRLAMESTQRHRNRTHTGSIKDLKYTLQTFGIPVSVLPIDDFGVVCCRYNRDFFEKQRLVEQRAQTRYATASPNVVSEHDEADMHLQPEQPLSLTLQEEAEVRITTPGNHDVLMGRGRSCQEHAGNVRFRFMIEQNLDRYDATPKHKKMSVALEILNGIHELGGRFLTPSDTGWTEIDEVAAREKISSCFRSFRKVKGNTKNKTSVPAPPLPKRQAEFSPDSVVDLQKHSRTTF